MAERSALLPGGWWLWCLVGLAIGLGGWMGSRSYLRKQLSAQLASAQTEQVAQQSIEALLRLDGDATIDVSRSLMNSNFMVANASFRALNQQLDLWSHLSASERIRRMAQVVVQLEAAPTDLDHDHRILFTGLASRIYADVLSNREAGAADVLAACKRIMASSDPSTQAIVTTSVKSSVDSVSDLGNVSPADSRVDLRIQSRVKSHGASDVPYVERGAPDSPNSLRVITNSPPPLHGALASTTSRPQSATPSMSALADPSNSDGSGYVSPVPPPLPPLQPETLTSAQDQAVSSTLSDRSDHSVLSDAETGSTGYVPDYESRSHAASTRRLGGLPAERVALSSGRATVQLTARSVAEREPTKSGTTMKMSDSSDLMDDQDATSQINSPVDNMDIELTGIDQLPIEQLVRLLASLQPRVAQSASLALRRKGMSDDKMALAMKLANGTADERLQLLRETVVRDDLDPRPWLLWMAGDGDPQVREQAVGLLSPLLDTDVRRQLRLLLNKERDERVSQTMRRVLVQ